MTTTNMHAKEPSRVEMSVRTGMKPFKTSDVTGTSEPSLVPTEGQTHTDEKPLAAETPKEDQLSPKYAEIARREKWLRAQRQEVEREKQALKAKESELQTGYLSKADLKAKLSQDLMGFLTENGIQNDQLLNLALNGSQPQNQELMALKNEVTELKALLQQTQKQTEESKNTAYEQAVKDIRREAQLLVDSDERFETIKGSNSLDSVVELITETHAKEGILLSVEEAAQEIENYLVEEFAKYANLNKVKAKVAPAVEAKPQAPEKTIPTKTLTNAHVAQTPTRTNDKERIQRAILAFKGQLPN